MPSRTIFIIAIAATLLAMANVSLATTTTTPAAGGPVLVFGGTSGTGLGAVQALRARKIPVTVFARPTSDLSGLKSLGVQIVTGDALDATAVQAAFASGKFVAVISSLGGRRGEPRPDLTGNKNITAAAKAAGVRRVVQVSSMGTGKSRQKPAPGDHFMAEVLYLKTLAEDDLIASGLDYTIIRPGGLRDGPPTGTGILTPEERLGTIDRNELGRLVAAALYDDTTVGKVLSALDPTLPPPPGRE
ncbi:MAG: SDR family oxidoreductase [Gammaproteobacteria bacterium]|nr:SDR family oxidoreductase [Gammaproteobacteria bacterium]